MVKTQYGADSSNHANLVYSAHRPIIVIFKDDSMVKKPYVVEDIGGAAHYILSRHKSFDAARRAIRKYHKMISAGSRG